MAGRLVRTPPDAGILIESLRDVGYSVETALADLIDNSLSAQAQRIEILLDPAGSRLGVLDDGVGMSEAELLNAMRPGSRNPRAQRAATDLGRFGLGLKTASFSQCRRVTIVTSKAGALSAATWDLDLVAERDEWLVEVPDQPHLLPWADRLGERGTLVLWEKLDRLAPDGSDASMQLAEKISSAENHLALVFHRFVQGEPGRHRVAILINGRAVEAIDPFATSHPATIKGPKETILYRREEVVVQPFTLPHRNKVPAREWERLGGKLGYFRTQGFYLYRERRLIVHGTWFGLVRQTELTKLARVRIDIPNTLDAEWRIDVKKASAQPPHKVRERLKRIIGPLAAPSKRVFIGRGTRLVETSRLPVWHRTVREGSIIYEVNGDHPVLRQFSQTLTEAQATELGAILRLIAAALPFETMYADFGTDGVEPTGSPMTDEELIDLLNITLSELLKAGINKAVMLEMLRGAEPFRTNWNRISPLLPQLSQS